MKNGKIHLSTASDLKASVVERFNHTLKTRMWKYFTANTTHRYLKVLQDLMKSYNNSYHKNTKMTPIQVTPKNSFQVFCDLYAALPSCHQRAINISVSVGSGRPKGWKSMRTGDIF